MSSSVHTEIATPMTAYLLTDHILNFLVPAACAALLLVLLSRVFSRFLAPKVPLAQSIYAQAAILLIVNALVLIIGLVVFGNDGKMLTYAAMVTCSALCQWVMWRGWRA